MHEVAAGKSFAKKAKYGVVWSFAREGISEIFLLPASLVMARLLTPEEFGIAAAAGFFTQLSDRLSRLGFNMALVRSRDIRPIHLSTVFVVDLLVGMITFALLTAAAPFVAAFYAIPETGRILPTAAMGFLIAPLGTVPAAILARELRFRESAMVDWYQGLAFAASSVVFAWFGFSYMSVVYGKLIATLVQTGARMAFARWRPSLSFSMLALREILSFGAGSHAKSLLDYAAKNVDNLIVGKFFGIAALGFYDKAFSTMNRALTRMNDGGPGVVFRIFSLIHDDAERFRRAYAKVVMSSSMLAFPAFAVLIVTAPQFMIVVFGPRWLPAAVPFQILCLGALLKLLNSYASAATQAAGYIWSEVWRQVTYTALIVGSLIALRRWGPAGAATGVLFATAVMAVLMHVLLIRITTLRWTDVFRPQVPASLCAIGAAGAALLTEYAVRSAVGAPAAWLLLASQTVIAITFCSLFVLFAPHRGLRALVHEMAIDLFPARVTQHRWVQAYLRTIAAEQRPSATV
jgi:O-antigen/teichoic acid export membrane protein